MSSLSRLFSAPWPDRYLRQERTDGRVDAETAIVDLSHDDRFSIPVLAEALVAALNPQLASLARAQLAARIERETVRWIGERVGWSGERSAALGAAMLAAILRHVETFA